jgi:formylglycine-generating enzyme required for sulfatase activity
LNDTAQAQMLALEGGPAVLGSTEGERVQARLDYGVGGEQLFSNEGRARRAHVTGFRIDRMAVTNALYHEFVEACGTPPPNHESLPEATWNALKQRHGLAYSYAQIVRFLWDDHAFPADHARYPVVLVSHDDAGLYCAWRGARLPTEDEWERAARGREGRNYPWGTVYDQFRVNNAARRIGGPVEVGALPQGASPEGVLDLGGNVYEWTASPWPTSADSVVVKGNGWDGRGGYGRGAARLAFSRGLRNVNLGFRCAAGLN